MHGIVKLSLGGENRILKFNQYCLIHAATILKCDPLNVPAALYKLAQKNIARPINIIVYSGIMGFLEEEADYTHDVELKDVAKWVQDCDENALLPIWAAFRDANGISDALAKQSTPGTEIDDEKKKQSPLPE